MSARLSRILDLSDTDIADEAIQEEILHQELGDAIVGEGDESIQHAPSLVCEAAPSSKSARHRRHSMSESVEAIIQRRSAEVIKKTKHLCQVCKKKKVCRFSISRICCPWRSDLDPRLSP